MKEEVFILGGSGFVGKHLSVYLSEYYRVTVFDMWIDSEYFSAYPAIQVYEIDLIYSQIPDIFITPTFIINLASPLVTASRELDGVNQLIADNIRILKNIFERFKDDNLLKLLIQFGSIEEYGTAKSPFKETDREYPNSAYALMKQASTNLAIMLNKNFNFPAMVVRPGNLFGKFQSENRFIPYVYHRLSKNKDLEVTGCEQKRDFIYINDFNHIILKILARSWVFVGEIVNISSGQSIILKDIVEKLKLLLSSKSNTLYGVIPYRLNESLDIRCNIDKLEYLLEEKIEFRFFENLEILTKIS